MASDGDRMAVRKLSNQLNNWSRFRRLFLWRRGWEKERGKHAATGK